MLSAQLHHELTLEAVEVEEMETELLVRNYLLLTRIDENIVAATSEEYLVEASNYYSKLPPVYPFVVLDEESFERLYKRFLELRTDRQIETMQGEGESSEITDGDLSLTEFLRTSSDILTSEESAPIIKFVNALFYQAVKRKASDIHIEVHEKRGEVRFRIDGVLTKNADLEKKVITLIISRIKVISNLDISENRIPQDGRTQIKIAGESLDIRVSILPTFINNHHAKQILETLGFAGSGGERGIFFTGDPRVLYRGLQLLAACPQRCRHPRFSIRELRQVLRRLLLSQNSYSNDPHFL